MIAEVHQLKEEYIAWLNDKTTLRQVEDWVVVTTPFLDRHNDYIQVYVTGSASGYMITDDGYTIADLEAHGCNLNSPKRQSLLSMTLRGFGIQQVTERNALQVRASKADFALRKHNLIQAMLAVNDLFFTASTHVRSFFYEDIETWLESASIRFTPKAKFTGKSGFDHLYDFVIPKSSQLPERVVLGINRPDRNNIERTVFAWEDTRDARKAKSSAYVLLNDIEHSVPKSAVSALRAYGVHPVPWSERESVREELAA